MKFLIHIGVLVVSSLLLGGCARQVESVKGQYSDVWTNRLADYRAGVKAQQGVLINDVARYRTILVSAKTSSEGTKSAIAGIRQAMDFAFRLRGRLVVLERFEKKRSTSPTMGLWDAWFYTEFDQLKELMKNWGERRQRFSERLADKSRPYSNLWTDWVKLLSDHAMLTGGVKEVLQLHTEMKGYVSDYARAERADNRRRKALARALMAFSQQMQQQQILYELRRPRTCTTIGNSTTCY